MFIILAPLITCQSQESVARTKARTGRTLASGYRQQYLRRS